MSANDIKMLETAFSDKRKPTFDLQWLPSYACNYRCPYCIQGHKRKLDKIDISLIEHYAEVVCGLSKRIKSLINPTINYDFSLIGGEVTIFPLKKMLFDKMDTSIFDNIRIVTNFSQSYDYYAELLSSYNNIRLSCSFHPSQAKWSEFFEKACKLSEIVEDKSSVKVILMKTRENSKQVGSWLHDCLREKLNHGLIAERYEDNTLAAKEVSSDEVENELKRKKCFIVTLKDGSKQKISRYEAIQSINTIGAKCFAHESKLRVTPDGMISSACDVSCIRLPAETITDEALKALMRIPITCTHRCNFCNHTSKIVFS